MRVTQASAATPGLPWFPQSASAQCSFVAVHWTFLHNEVNHEHFRELSSSSRRRRRGWSNASNSLSLVAPTFAHSKIRDSFLSLPSSNASVCCRGLGSARRCIAIAAAPSSSSSSSSSPFYFPYGTLVIPVDGEDDSKRNSLGKEIRGSGRTSAPSSLVGQGSNEAPAPTKSKLTASAASPSSSAAAQASVAPVGPVILSKDVAPVGPVNLSKDVGKWRAALLRWRGRLEDISVPAGIDEKEAYAAAVKYSLRLKLNQTAVKLLRVLREAGLEDFNTMSKVHGAMRAYSAVSMPLEAVDLLTRLPALGLKADVKVYRGLLRMLANGESKIEQRRPQGRSEEYRTRKITSGKDRQRPDAQTESKGGSSSGSSSRSGGGGADGPKGSLRPLSAAEESVQIRGDDDHGVVIGPTGVKVRLKLLLQVLEEAATAGRLDQYCMSAIVVGHLNAGRPADAIPILRKVRERMKDTSNKGLTATPGVWASLLKACAALPRTPRAQQGTRLEDQGAGEPGPAPDERGVKMKRNAVNAAVQEATAELWSAATEIADKRGVTGKGSSSSSHSSIAGNDDEGEEVDGVDGSSQGCRALMLALGRQVGFEQAVEITTMLCGKLPVGVLPSEGEALAAPPAEWDCSGTGPGRGGGGRDGRGRGLGRGRSDGIMAVHRATLGSSDATAAAGEGGQGWRPAAVSATQQGERRRVGPPPSVGGGELLVESVEVSADSCGGGDNSGSSVRILGSSGGERGRREKGLVNAKTSVTPVLPVSGYQAAIELISEETRAHAGLRRDDSGDDDGDNDDSFDKGLSISNQAYRQGSGEDARDDDCSFGELESGGYESKRGQRSAVLLEECIDVGHKPTLSMLHMTLRACADDGDAVTASHIFEKFKAKRRRSSGSNSSSSKWRKSKHVTLATEAKGAMEKKLKAEEKVIQADEGDGANSESDSASTSRAAPSILIAGVLGELLSVADEEEVVMAYGALLTACARAGDWKRLMHYFTELRTAGLMPNDLCFKLAMRAFERTQQSFERVMDSISDMRNQFKRQKIKYMETGGASGRSKRERGMLFFIDKELFEQSRRRGAWLTGAQDVPDSTLSISWPTVGMSTVATTTGSSGRTRLPPFLPTHRYMQAIAAAVNLLSSSPGNARDALQLFDDVEKFELGGGDVGDSSGSGDVRRTVSWLLPVEVPLDTGDNAGAAAVVEDKARSATRRKRSTRRDVSSSEGVTTTTTTTTTSTATATAFRAYFGALVACGQLDGEGYRSLGIIRRMTEEGIQPTQKCYNAAMSACLRSGMWKETLGLFDEMMMASDVLRSMHSSGSSSSDCHSCSKGDLVREMTWVPDAQVYVHVLNALAMGIARDVAADTQTQLYNSAMQLLQDMLAGQTHHHLHYAARRLLKNSNNKSSSSGSSSSSSMSVTDGEREEGAQDEEGEDDAEAPDKERGSGRRERADLDTVTSSHTIPAPTLYIYNAALDVCDKAKRWEKALSLLEVMELQGVEPDVVSYTSVMSACNRAGEWVQTINLWEKVRSITPKGRRSTLSSSGSPALFTPKSKLSPSSSANGDWKPNLHMYSCVIQAFAIGRRYTQAVQTLNGMWRVGLTPNNVCYGAAINACARAGRWEKAVSLLDEMRDRAEFVGKRTSRANRPVNVAGNVNPADDSSDAKGVRGRGGGGAKGRTGGNDRTDEYRPNAYCYAAAIRACGAAGKWRQAVGLLEQMTADGVKADGYTLAAVIKACGDCGMWEKALDLLGVVHDLSMAATQECYNAAITACGDANQWEEAMVIMQQMGSHAGDSSNSAPSSTGDMKLSKNAPPPNIFTYTAALRALARSGQAILARNLLKEMKGRGIKPNAFCYTHAVEACVNAGDPAMAFAVLKDMKVDRVPMNTGSYSAAICACALTDQWIFALSFWEEMNGRRVKQTLSLASLLSELLVRSGQPEMAIDTYRDALASGVLTPWGSEKLGVLDLRRFGPALAGSAIRVALQDVQKGAGISLSSTSSSSSPSSSALRPYPSYYRHNPSVDLEILLGGSGAGDNFGGGDRRRRRWRGGTDAEEAQRVLQRIEAVNAVLREYFGLDVQNFIKMVGNEGRITIPSSLLQSLL